MAKRLDHFLLREEVVSRLPAFRHWVGEGGDLDHLPILLEMQDLNKKPGAPFKFNPSWLEDESFINIFKSTWRTSVDYQGRDKAYLFMENLTCMKNATIE